MIEFESRSKLEIFTVENQLIGRAILMDVTDRFLYISKPIHSGVVRNLRMDGPIRVICYAKGKVFEFDTTVMQEITDNVPLYQLPVPRAVHTVQRRRNVRIPWTVELRYAALDEAETMLDPDQVFEKLEKHYADRLQSGLSVDLSGEGIGIITGESYEMNQRIAILIDHPQLSLATWGRVRRITFNPDQGNYRLGISFSQISEREKEKIIQFVFKKMRDQMRMRLKDR